MFRGSGTVTEGAMSTEDTAPPWCHPLLQGDLARQDGQVRMRTPELPKQKASAEAEAMRVASAPRQRRLRAEGRAGFHPQGGQAQPHPLSPPPSLQVTPPVGIRNHTTPWRVSWRLEETIPAAADPPAPHPWLLGSLSP